MKIVAILPVRNEDWILGLSLRALLMWVDEVVICAHACTDQTVRIIHEVSGETKRGEHIEYINGRVWYFTADSECWREMAQRQNLLELARTSWQATHIVTVDADEILTGDLLSTIRQRIEALPLGVMLRLPLLNLRGSLERVHDTGLWGSRDMVTSVAFRDEPGIHWPAAAEYQHHCREPKGRQWVMAPPANRESGLMHLQFVSERRLKAKHYWYQLQERLRWPSALLVPMVQMYQRSVREHCAAPGIGAPVPDRWWAPYAHLMGYLHVDREPWQIAEAQRILREHPGIEVGLDNFGLEL